MSFLREPDAEPIEISLDCGEGLFVGHRFRGLIIVSGAVIGPVTDGFQQRFRIARGAFFAFERRQRAAPVLECFIHAVAERQLIGGLTAGATKG